MRKQENLTKAEGLVWNMILKGKRTWYQFLRQKPLGNYILDFYSQKLKLAIEIDGKSHDWKAKEDEERTAFLNTLWIKVLRYTNEQVYYHLESVAEAISIEIDLRSKELFS